MMLKPLLAAAFLIGFSAAGAQTQTTAGDSIKTTIAKEDAEFFRLNTADFIKFRRDRHNFASDYFKPAKIVVSDIALLNDSVYVKAYRSIAYKKTRRRHTAWHYIIGVYAVLLLASGIGSAFSGKH